MDNLLIFFALPVATIILAIVFQKILKNPLLVAATFFAIYLIVTFAVFDASFLVYAILYTILAYVTAVLTKLVCKLITILQNSHICNCGREECNHNNCNGLVTTAVQRPITINNTSPCTTVNLASEASLLANANTRRRTSCNCCCRRR